MPPVPPGAEGVDTPEMVTGASGWFMHRACENGLPEPRWGDPQDLLLTSRQGSGVSTT